MSVLMSAVTEEETITNVDFDLLVAFHLRETVTEHSSVVYKEFKLRTGYGNAA